MRKAKQTLMLITLVAGLIAAGGQLGGGSSAATP